MTVVKNSKANLLSWDQMGVTADLKGVSQSARLEGD